MALIIIPKGTNLEIQRTDMYYKKINLKNKFPIISLWNLWVHNVDKT